MGDDPNFIQIGPAGGRYAKNTHAWDEKGHHQLVQIFISHGDSGIHSIQFQYVVNGARVMSNRHGSNYGPDSSKFNVVNLNYPVEYITWIKGKLYCGNLGSLTIGTNCGKYGPFGRSKELDGHFRFELGGDCQFGGFHGSADSWGVKSIGVYLKPTARELHVVKREKKSI